MKKKIWLKTHSFRFTEEYSEIDNYIRTLSSKERAAYIREALYWYYKYGEIFKELVEGVAEMKNLIKLISAGEIINKKVEQKNDAEQEEYLYFEDGMFNKELLGDI